MNNVILMGRLTRDPETRTAQSGTAVTRYTLAVKRDVKDETDFINVIAFGKNGEFAQKYLKKGMQILIQGKLRVSTWDKDGEKRYSTDVVVDRHEFTEKKQEQTTPSSDGWEGLPF